MTRTMTPLRARIAEHAERIAASDELRFDGDTVTIGPDDAPLTLTITYEPDDCSLLDETGPDTWCGEIVRRERGDYGGGNRPSHFDGRARVLRPWHRGSDEFWWQPPADIADVAGFEAIILRIMRDGYSVVIVSDDHGNAASLGGIDPQFTDHDQAAWRRETIAELVAVVLSDAWEA